MPKIGRRPLTMYITEKLDGTNASIHIFHKDDTPDAIPLLTSIVGDYCIFTASRKRWIAPNREGHNNDNMGFAKWVKNNAEEIVKLGIGTHFGEWVGPGVQKNPHELDEKRFYLFNHYRWVEVQRATICKETTAFPMCVDIVPWMVDGLYTQEGIDAAMLKLKERGSLIGGKPEGIMVYIPEADHYQKVTFEHSKGKWNKEE